MKTKEFKQLTERYRNVSRELRELNDYLNFHKFDKEKAGRVFELSELKKELKKEFEKVDKVFASYWIGSRRYYEQVYKVGKRLYSMYNYQSLTRVNGYHNVEVIPEITEKMKREMIDDSYYY